MESESNIILTIANATIFVIATSCVIALAVGAFMNARREAKGLPKKNRKSMIIFLCAVFGVCWLIFTTINPVGR